MGLASIVLGILAMIGTAAGFLLTWVPVLGSMLSFGSPVLALIGIVLGGVDMSRAKQDGRETGLPLAGLIISITAFFPALFVAITCGMCNAMCTSAGLNGGANGRNGQTPFWLLDGGTVSPGVTPSPAPAVPPGPAVAPGVGPSAPPDPSAPDPSAPDPVNLPPDPPDPSPPPPDFPPPPPPPG